MKRPTFPIRGLAALVAMTIVSTGVAGAGVTMRAGLALSGAAATQTPATSKGPTLRFRSVDTQNEQFTKSSKYEVRFARNGNNLAVTPATNGGNITAPELLTGGYSMMVDSEAGLAIGVQVFDETNVNGNFWVDAGLVPTQDVALVKQILGTADAVRPILMPHNQYYVSMLDPTRDMLKAIEGDGFRLLPDGSIEGIVSVVSSSVDGTSNIDEVSVPAEVHFVRNGVEVAHVLTDDNGLFRIEGLTEGIYSIVAIGADGVAAQSVPVIRDNSEDMWLTQIILAPNENVAPIEAATVARQPATQSFGAAGAQPGSAVGNGTVVRGQGGGLLGGGGGGLGVSATGIGAALAAGGIALSIVAIAKANDDDDRVVSPAAP